MIHLVVCQGAPVVVCSMHWSSAVVYEKVLAKIALYV